VRASARGERVSEIVVVLKQELRLPRGARVGEPSLELDALALEREQRVLWGGVGWQAEPLAQIAGSDLAQKGLNRKIGRT
jgi:hypothetical protein